MILNMVLCNLLNVECGLTRSTWLKNPFKNAPSYDVVVREKSKCRPSRPLPPTGTSVQTPMQNVVNHTVDRILRDKTVVKHIAELKEKYGSVELQFIYKFGLGTIHILRKQVLGLFLTHPLFRHYLSKG